MADILEDLKIKLEAIGFKDPKIETVIMEVRKEWSGERPYISARYESDQKMSERNRAIIRQYKDGESVAFLARRYKLSRQRIHKIISG